MSTPGSALAPTVIQGSVIQPTGMAGPQAAAVFALGGVLKDLIHRSGSYVSENDLDAAVTAVEAFVRAFAKPSEIKVLSNDEERASKEDVTQRIPPGGLPPRPAPALPAIDYERLASAIYSKMQQAQVPPQDITSAPETPQVQGNPYQQ